MNSISRSQIYNKNYRFEPKNTQNIIKPKNSNDNLLSSLNKIINNLDDDDYVKEIVIKMKQALNGKVNKNIYQIDNDGIDLIINLYDIDQDLVKFYPFGNYIPENIENKFIEFTITDNDENIGVGSGNLIKNKLVQVNLDNFYKINELGLRCKVNLNYFKLPIVFTGRYDFN